jgi:hypothetical protein
MEKGFGFMLLIMTIWITFLIGAGSMLIYILGSWAGVF